MLQYIFNLTQSAHWYRANEAWLCGTIMSRMLVAAENIYLITKRRMTTSLLLAWKEISTGRRWHGRRLVQLRFTYIAMSVQYCN